MIIYYRSHPSTLYCVRLKNSIDSSHKLSYNMKRAYEKGDLAAGEDFERALQKLKTDKDQMLDLIFCLLLLVVELIFMTRLWRVHV